MKFWRNFNRKTKFNGREKFEKMCPWKDKSVGEKPHPILRLAKTPNKYFAENYKYFFCRVNVSFNLL